MTSMTGLAEFHLQQLIKKGKGETTFGRLKNKNSSPPTTYRSLGQLTQGVKFAQNSDKLGPEGFGSLAQKVSMPRTSSEIRMSWT